jgi:hypothetical protein
MSRKVQLRLIASTKMANNEEHSVVRFPRKAREHFGFSQSRVSIGKGSYEISLQVKQAYKEDVRRLAGMIRGGKITEEEALCVGFVTRRIRDKVTRKKGNGDVWVTDGIGNITVGADPEFGLIDGNNMLVRGNHVVSHDGQFGSDGPGIEIRPAPSTDHLQMVRNMRGILMKPPAKVDGYLWKGGATFKDVNRVYWFGGHIHLGRPLQIDSDYAFEVYERIASALDGLLALPMVRFDTPEPHLRRNGCKYGYGKAGGSGKDGGIQADFPEQNRFEYRVLSGLWLVHPTLSKVAIGAAKCIAETAYSRIAENGFDPEWASNPISKKGMLKSFGISGIQEVRAIINRARPEAVTAERLQNWERNVQNLDRFDDYKAELAALIALSKEDPSNITDHISLDLRKNWQEESTLLPRASKKLRKALDQVEEQE